MKNTLLFLIALTICAPKISHSQNEGAAIAAVAGGLLVIGSGIAAIEQMKEQAELTATQWFLTNHSSYDKFSLKTLSFDGKKLKDLSTTSVLIFKVREFDIIDRDAQLGERLVLFGFTSKGWINEYGINFDKVKWFLVDEKEWMKMMTAYTKVASGINNEEQIRTALRGGKVINRGVKAGKGEDIDFYKIKEDMYLVTDYNNEMKFVYNERSLGIYLKQYSVKFSCNSNAII